MSEHWDVKEEYRTLFIEESQDQMDEWEESLLSLEKDPEDREQIDRLFRAVHTLKGSAGFVGFEELQRFAHDLESALQDVRDGNARLGGGTIDLLFEGLDLAKRLIDAFASDDRSGADIGDFLRKLEQSGPGGGGEGAGAEDTGVEKASTEDGGAPGGDAGDAGEPSGGSAGAPGGADTYRMEIRIDTIGHEAYLKALLVQHKLEEIGRVLVVSPSLEELKLGGDDFRYEVVLETDLEEAALRKIVDLDRVSTGEVARIEGQGPGEASPGLEDGAAGAGEDAGEAPAAPSPELDDGQLPSGQSSAPEGGETPEERKSGKGSRPVKSEEVVRVPVDKLDVMLNLVGELVVQNSGFISTTDRIREQYGRGHLVIDLEEKTESLAKIARDLQDAVMKVRMLPVAAVFNRFTRVVRDLAKDRGKKVELVIFGEETEIDKKVMDRIGEPLVHLVRNAVDHGIESDAERRAAGKSPTARLHLGAYQEGVHICIDVSDDGRGLDREKILGKGIDRGLISPQEAESLSDAEAFRLIFQPGFSTAEKVTDISGRGVGLDVVKRTVEDMGGDVRVRSRKGVGTTITITLPLTMAIIPAILVGVSDSLFAIPLSSVREVVKVRRGDLHPVQGSMALQLRDEVISVADLRQVLDLGLSGSEDENSPVVIVDYAGYKVGVKVERLLGNEEIVIKSLSRHYREIEGMVGASIMGDGRIALILDVENMVKRFCRESGLRGGGSLNVSVGSSELRGGAPVDQAAGMDQAHDFSGETTAAAAAEGEPAPGAAASGDGATLDEAAADYEDGATLDEAAADSGDEAAPGEAAVSSGGGGNAPGARQTAAPLLELEQAQRQMLEEIHAGGAVSASMSMSLFMDRDIRVSFPETRVINISQAGDELGGDETPVGGIFVPLHGDIRGAMLMVLPEKELLAFSDLIMRREPGTTTQITEEESSGLMEMGNILTASFINAMADETGLSIGLDVPEMRVDMCLSVIDNVLAGFNQPGERIILTQAELYFSDQDQAVCYMLLFLDVESMEVMSRALSGMQNKESAA
ncbi:MAG: chemotaxis protein CheW [Spirochaetota bacterium]